MMRIGLVAALALAATLGACDRGGGGEAPATPKEREEARADAVADEQKALRDSGVTVDTQIVDTGSAAPPSPPPAAEADN